MKKFATYLIINIEVCIPSTDYYRRDNDYQTENINQLVFIDNFDTLEKAEASLSNIIGDENYTILPIYSKIKK